MTGIDRSICCANVVEGTIGAIATYNYSWKWDTSLTAFFPLGMQVVIYSSQTAFSEMMKDMWWITSSRVIYVLDKPPP